MTRVIAVGIDAVEPSLITTLIREGRLPHLAQLHARAATVDLTTGSDFRAEFPWNEFCTGRRASTLRYWTTVTFDPDAYATYMRGAPDAEPFYAVGDDATVIAFDLPKVVRSSGVRGVQILGWGAHSPQYPFGSMPDSEYDALMTAFRPSPGLDIEYAGAWHQPEYLTRLADVQSNAVRTRAQILRWLASRTPEWTLLLTLIGETHQLGHMTAHGFVGRLAQAPTAPVARAAMITALEAVDAVVADIVSWVPADTTVIVFSVQGMTSADDETASYLVPEMILRNAIGEARLPATELGPWRRRGAPPVIPAVWDDPIEWLERRFRSSASATRRQEAWRRARHALRTYAPAVPRARRRLSGIPEPPAPTGPAPPTEFPFRDDSLNDWIAAAWYRDAWPRLPAFAIPGFSDTQIRINLDGRERDGIVDRDDYARVCDDVERMLRSCRNGATGAPVVREVHRIRADDPYAPDGPPADLIVQLHGADAIEHPELGAVGPIVAARTGGHTTNGFAFVVGPGIAPGPRGTFAVCDLSATILELLGAHPSAPLDGRPFLSSDVHT